MQLARYALVVVVGCHSQPKATMPIPRASTGSTASAASTTAASAASSASTTHDCSCEQIEAPVEVTTDDRARWERAAREIDALVADLAALFPNGTCAATINADVAHVLAAHLYAVRENRALDQASCDVFTRWRTARSDGSVEEPILRAVRGACLHLSDASGAQLALLLVTRSCTMFSND